MVAHLVHDVWSQILGILARFLGDQSTVIVAVEQLEVPLLCLYRLERCLGMYDIVCGRCVVVCGGCVWWWRGHVPKRLAEGRPFTSGDQAVCTNSSGTYTGDV